MKKKRIALFLLLTAAFLLLLFLIYAPARQTPSASGPYSVILYQYTDNDWDSLLEGIRQAEKDVNAVVNYAAMPLNGTPEQELELLNREIANGAAGILLAPVDSDALGEAVGQLAKSVPIVTLETGPGEDKADITADNYEMGRLLGREMAAVILEDAESARSAESGGGEASSEAPEVCIIAEYTQRESVRQRSRGFLDALRELVPDANVQELKRSEGDYSLPLYLSYQYANHHAGAYLAALDKYCTEALIEASETYAASAPDADAALFAQRAFGTGNTLRTVSGLDTGAIRGLVYQNEFNIGYQGLLTLIEKDRNRGNGPGAGIDYYYVTRDTLYEPENQRLLFPLT